MGAAQPLIITAGEPAGIGPELCLSLVNESLPCPFAVISDPALLRERAAAIGLDVTIREIDINDSVEAAAGELLVVPVSFPAQVTAGVLNPDNAQALLDGLAIAAQACLDGTFAGLVTAPLQKSVINDAGIPFSGHTEFLAELTDARVPVMLLAAGDLRRSGTIHIEITYNTSTTGCQIHFQTTGIR